MPLKKLLLAIGSPDKCESSIWRIWSNPKGDIYVADQILGGIYKMSLHKDGKCQFGFTTEYAQSAQYRFGVGNRHIERWKLPDANILCALKILVPASELRDLPIDKTKNISWLKTPPAESIGTISVFIAKPYIELKIPHESENAWHIGKLETSIRNAWIFYAFTYPDDALKGLVSNEKQRLSEKLKGQTVPPGTRACLWDSKKESNRHVLELSCDFDKPEK